MSAGRYNLLERPQKRVKLSQEAKEGLQLASPHDFRRGLLTQDEAVLTEVLSSLRSKLSLRNSEDISLDDDRLVFVKQWMDLAPAAHDIFELWNNVQTRQASLSVFLVSITSSVLTLLSSHAVNFAYGFPIVKNLLAQQSIRRLSSYLGGSNNELILVTLRLFNAMSTFGRAREAQSVLDSFPWEVKSTIKFLHMRRKSKVEDKSDMILRPDIRTLYILFLLSFLSQDTTAVVKSSFLEQRRDAFLHIFKGLAQDSHTIVRKVLETCWSGIWMIPRIKRTVKVGLFNEATMNNLLKLYDRTAPEHAEADYVPAEIVHHFLLSICTRPGSGICFRDRGWYPRESDVGHGDVQDDEEISASRKGGKIYNKILSNVLKKLKVNEDSMQQELAMKIMLACPELVAGYWSAAALTLEPRLSSRWIANISFFGSVLSQPVPIFSFFLADGSLYQPSPPPLATIMENILPSVNTKVHLSRGLQSTSYLVQHCTALALVKCLVKYGRVIAAFCIVEDALEEDENGQWTKRRAELERDVRRRVPEFQVIVAFSQQKPLISAHLSGSEAQPLAQPDSVKLALLSEVTQRLLYLYHRCLPSLVAEARFDVGKLLHSFVDADYPEGADGWKGTHPTIALQTVKQLHVLKLLKESDEFAWSGRIAPSPRSNLQILLKLFCSSRVQAVRQSLHSLLSRVLSSSVLFQEKADEVDIWLLSFPCTRRLPDARSPDGAPLTDEIEATVVFMDDCIQRGLKTPHRYLEELQQLLLASASDDPSDVELAFDDLPSLLVMVVLEQLGAKLSGKLLSSSDALAIVTLVRKLLFKLGSRQQDMRIVLALTDRFVRMVEPGISHLQHSSLHAAIQREIAVLRECLGQSPPSRLQNPDTIAAVNRFIEQIEKNSQAKVVSNDVTSAYELVDWLRLVDPILSPAHVKCLVQVIERLHRQALHDFFACLHLEKGLLWSIVDSNARGDKLYPELTFDLLFVHASPEELSRSTSRELLANMVSSQHATQPDIKGVICIINHRLSSTTSETLQHDLLCLLAEILRLMKKILSSVEMSALKEYLFVKFHVIRAFCLSQDVADAIKAGIFELIDVTLDHTSDEDRKLARTFSTHWMNVLKNSLASIDAEEVSMLRIWIPFLEPAEVWDLADSISRFAITRITDPMGKLLEIILSNLNQRTNALQSEISMRGRMRQLMTFRTIIPNSLVLEDTVDTAVASHAPLCLDGSLVPRKNDSVMHLNYVTSWAKLRWCAQADAVPQDVAFQYITGGFRTHMHAIALSSLLYKYPAARQELAKQLTVAICSAASVYDLSTIMFVLLDPAVDAGPVRIEGEVLDCALLRLLPQRRRTTVERRACTTCIPLLISRQPHRCAQVLEQVHSAFIGSRAGDVVADYAMIAASLGASDDQNINDLLLEMIDLGLRWAVQRFSDSSDFDLDTRKTLKELELTTRSIPFLKAHLVEPVLSAVAQARFSDGDALAFAAHLVKKAPLKPVVVNRFLQSVIQHRDFFKLSRIGNPQRNAIIRYLHALFHSHPANTCQPSHIQPLVKIYGGTLSTSDLQLMSIFQLFETQRKVSLASVFTVWSSTPDVTSSSHSEAIQSLETSQMIRTCLTYPVWRGLIGQHHPSSIDESIYDPAFILPLFSAMLSESLPCTVPGWISMFRTNIVGFLVRSLSSNDAAVREAALCQLAALWQCLKTSNIQEEGSVMYILRLLKNVISKSSDERPPQLPSHITLFLFHALKGIFYPSNFIYPLTARFLLQRPELDVTDVPMLFRMLYSSNEDWKKERGWIIRFIADGMANSDDWILLKRRHTWDLLASLFQSSHKELALRTGILEVLANLTCNSRATTSLVLRSSLLVWIEMQLQDLRGTEIVAWLKILENIVTSQNVAKLESATDGRWRSTTCRCLRMLMEDSLFESSIPVLVLAIRLILRVSALSGDHVLHLPALLRRAVHCLKRTETDIEYKMSDPEHVEDHAEHVLPPHGARTLWTLPSISSPLHAWGKSVELLWRASMTFPQKSSTWDALTCRLLLWRVIAGEKQSPVGEWARREVIRNFSV